ncbi:hypothetical protein EYF80_045918 [Liparis tanakae]|uniref:Uncharacterized protein n=1 Tax=Liparis tanakae TaxID=230148 RepID=A0A4Z2FRN1_9TELE|nr:hypothetical protein EYF80_045918 [Liparis tanakae]
MHHRALYRPVLTASRPQTLVSDVTGIGMKHLFHPTHHMTSTAQKWQHEKMNLTFKFQVFVMP